MMNMSYIGSLRIKVGSIVFLFFSLNKADDKIVCSRKSEQTVDHRVSIYHLMSTLIKQYCTAVCDLK